MTDTSTVEKRLAIGKKAENRVIALLLWHGIKAIKTGQEDWLPKWVHEKIRHIYDSEMCNSIRHFPDLSTDRTLIQVKAAPSENKYECVTIEKASYNTSKILSEYGVPILLVWMYADEKTFCAQWVDKINVLEPNTPRERLKGAKTPMYKVKKDQLKKLKEFIKDL